MPEQSWKDRFVESLVNWLVTTHGPEVRARTRKLCDSLEQAIPLQPPREGADQVESELFRAALRMHIAEAVEDRIIAFHEAWARTESPIERAMLAALLVTAQHRGNSVAFVLSGVTAHGKVRLGEDESGMDITIEPQAQMGEYRVDFLLTYREVSPDFSKTEQLPKPIHGIKEIPGTMIERREMVVECDGHDFHDRTKEQARRDRERDRWLQSLGFRVFRYTGSEIWADVFKAADQALEGLTTFEGGPPP